MVGGGKLYTGLAARAASRMGNPNEVSTKGYFMFGLSYGTASLSCTLPIFISVVGIGVAGSVPKPWWVTSSSTPWAWGW